VSLVTTHERPPPRPPARGRDHRTDLDPHGWRQELRDLARGVAAGSIVGMPLLFTMEMWWHGMTRSEEQLLVLLAATLGINFVLCRFGGFRQAYSVGEAASESVSSVGIGLLFSVAILWLIGEVEFDTASTDILGKVLIEAVPVSLGVSYANLSVRGKSRTGDDDRGKQDDPSGDGGGGGGGGGSDGHRAGDDAGGEDDPQRRQLWQDLKDVAATLSGATLFALNVAPTEEVLLIATRLPAWQHLLLMAASLGLCYLILFASGFQGDRDVPAPSPFQHPAAETIMAYAMSLLVAFVLLNLVGVPETMSSVAAAAQCTVTLGLVATVGGAAGRLIA
jgi:putative integral membrane protein (TIGR02587 family)